MRSSLNVGKDLVLELQKTGNPKLLLELFEVRTRDWKSISSYVEGGSIGIFDDLSFSSGLGFKLIPYATDLLLHQRKPDTFLPALDLLSICVYESETTEIPQILIEKWDTIKKRVEENGDKESAFLWEEISRWYRINSTK